MVGKSRRFFFLGCYRKKCLLSTFILPKATTRRRIVLNIEKLPNIIPSNESRRVILSLNAIGDPTAFNVSRTVSNVIFAHT